MNDIAFIEDQIERMRRSGIELDEYGADRMRALAHADDLQLFWIVNTADNKAFFLARTAKLARHLAVTANHILDLNNGSCFKANESFYLSNPGFGSSVKRAIRDRIPGLVVQKNNHAVMDDRVYSPLVTL